MGSSSVFFTTTLWLAYFYAPPPEAGRAVLVPVAGIGLVMAIGRFIEAFDDPLIGHWSDTTRSRLGRRAPFVLLGMPFMAALFLLLWAPPDAHESTLNAVYFFLVLELFYLAATVVLGPWEAILPEVARTPADRVSVSSWKVVAGTLGTALALVGTPFLVERFGFVAMAAVVVAVFWLTIWASLLGARSHMRYEHDPAEITFLGAAKATLTNRPFLAFSAGLVFFYLGFNLLIQVMPYFVRVVMGEGDERVSWFTGGLLAIVLLSLPLVAWAAARFGKKRTYAAGMLALVLYVPFWYFIGYIPGIPPMAQGLVYVALAGVPFAALHVFPNALMADVIDYDALRTGHRREAIYYGMQETLKKLAFALSTAVFALVLDLGFTADNPLGIRLMGPVAAVAVLIGFVLFAWGYRLPDAVEVGQKV